MDAKETITLERLKEVLHYDPDTGVFIWKVSRNNRNKAGKVAGYINNGYRKIKIDEELYLAHRLAWLYVYNSWPGLDIDHRDGNRSNNQISNLREATFAENMQNIHRAQRNSKSGHQGIVKRREKYAIFLSVDGRQKYFGSYGCIEEAILIRSHLKQKYQPFAYS